MVKPWIFKAENDLKAGKDEVVTDEPATDTVCFHMQQCAEKYLKAYLIFCNKEISKTHNIAALISAYTEIDESFQVLFGWDVHELTDYGDEIRYPNDFYFPSTGEAEEAVEMTERVKQFVRKN